LNHTHTKTTLSQKFAEVSIAGAVSNLLHVISKNCMEQKECQWPDKTHCAGVAHLHATEDGCFYRDGRTVVCYCDRHYAWFINPKSEQKFHSGRGRTNASRKKDSYYAYLRRQGEVGRGVKKELKKFLHIS